MTPQQLEKANHLTGKLKLKDLKCEENKQYAAMGIAQIRVRSRTDWQDANKKLLQLPPNADEMEQHKATISELCKIIDNAEREKADKVWVGE
jgi:hypothetical protein